MAMTDLGSVIRRLHAAALLHQGDGPTDGELLECFLNQRSEAAFEALVRRHGPMVLGLCRRVLKNQADAEDAFQATFLILVRKAASVVPRALVGNWLYGVAYKTALKAKAMDRKRRLKERQAAARAMPRSVAAKEVTDRLQELLDQELSQLGDKYRVPLVLCELEGRPLKEVARQLGWPQGTVASRLFRARLLLAKRLSRYGLALSAGALAALLTQHTASATVPAPLMVSTVKAALLYAAGNPATTGVISAQVAALTEGVLKAMFPGKLKMAAVLVLVLALAGTGVTVFSSERIVVNQTATKAAPPMGKAAEKSKKDQEKIQGTWLLVSAERAGKPAPDNFVHGFQLVFAEDKVTISTEGNTTDGTFTLDPTPKPKTIDLKWRNDEMVLGLYELEGEQLKIALGTQPNGPRPATFQTKETQNTLLVLKRKNEDKK